MAPEPSRCYRWARELRLGVSAKIFLAYAGLLAAFASGSVFTLLYLQRGRQEMAQNHHRREIQAAVDDAGRWLGVFRQAGGGTTSRIAAGGAIAYVRTQIKEARIAIDKALAAQTDRLYELELDQYRREVAALEARLLRAVGTGAGEPAQSPDQRTQGAAAADAEMLYLIADFDKLAELVRKRSADAAQRLMRDGKRAVDSALMLGAAGLLLAIGAALFVLRTLRPLGVLRAHARQIAGGDYARRVQVASRDEIGELAGEFDSMARAIEEREQRLIRSERLATVGRMAAQITHEIRNPLASVGLYVELLGDELGSQDAEARRLVAAIGSEVDRLSEITETYLRFVRLPRPKLEREDLGSVATAVMEFARAELSAAGIALELSVAAGLPEVAADENQIRQALLNLVRNAKEAMQAGGKIRVAVTASADGQVRLSVADTGSGIAPALLAKIFDPFFSTKDQGTGLGLALVQQIVTEHGGRIEVHGPPEGGTRFEIRLPALEPGESITAASPAAPESRPDLRPDLAKMN